MIFNTKNARLYDFNYPYQIKNTISSINSNCTLGQSETGDHDNEGVLRIAPLLPFLQKTLC